MRANDDMHSTLLKDRKRIVLVMSIIVVIAAASMALRAFAPQPAPPVAEQPVVKPIEVPPPLTPEITERLAESHGFQALVSYGGAGFQPLTVKIKKGETVRFFNGTAAGVHIVAAVSESGKPYPARSNKCGQAFDSCQPVQQGDFWEFTFDQAGTWSYRDTANPAHTGMVIVQ